MDLQLTVRAIQRILKEELGRHRDGFYNAYPQYNMTDIQKEIIESRVYQLQKQLKNCTSYAELSQYISDAGYRMSLEEWVKSL